MQFAELNTEYGPESSSKTQADLLNELHAPASSPSKKGFCSPEPRGKTKTKMVSAEGFVTDRTITIKHVRYGFLFRSVQCYKIAVSVKGLLNNVIFLLPGNLNSDGGFEISQSVPAIVLKKMNEDESKTNNSRYLPNKLSAYLTTADRDIIVEQ